MAKEKVIRKLAAILAADVVGYSRLVGADEEGTIARLKALRKQAIDPAIATHQGRIVKTMGDGLLVEFASVVEAVKCAVEWQRAIDARASDEPEDRRLQFRIGVNLGDIIIDGDDILGDGVNVAARLEGLSVAGGVCISGAVFEQIESKLDAVFDDAGEQKVKNIAKPVRVYRLRRDGAERVEVDAAADDAMPALDPPDMPSIAVLPFDNMSGDPEQEYFSDGITEDIITDLSKISSLFVIARNSTFAYKGTSKDMTQVCRELGVRYVLEGSVRKAGNRVRINAQLIDGTTGGHVWADRRDGDLTDIFALQDEVTNQIVTALRLTLTEDEGHRVRHKGTDNVEAYDWYVRGRELGFVLSKGTNIEKRQMFERAIRLDGDFAGAHAGLSMTLSLDYANQWSEDPAKSLEQAEKMARLAVNLHGNDPQGHFALGVVHLWQRQHDRARVEAEKAISLDPNAAEGRILLGNVLMYIGRREEAIEYFLAAMRRNPHYPGIVLHFLAQAHFLSGRYDDAVEVLIKRVRRNPETDSSRVLLAAAYGQLGRVDEARSEWEGALQINPDYSLKDRLGALPFKNPDDVQQIIDGLAKAGLPE